MNDYNACCIEPLGILFIETHSLSKSLTLIATRDEDQLATVHVPLIQRKTRKLNN